MTDRLKALRAVHRTALDEIRDEWKRADAVMLEWLPLGHETGGYEQIAKVERLKAADQVNRYCNDVVAQLLPLVGEQLQRDLISLSDRLLDMINDPRQFWEDELDRQCRTVDRLLSAVVKQSSIEPNVVRGQQYAAADKKIAVNPDPYEYVSRKAVIEVTDINRGQLSKLIKNSGLGEAGRGGRVYLDKFAAHWWHDAEERKYGIGQIIAAERELNEKKLRAK